MLPVVNMPGLRVWKDCEYARVTQGSECTRPWDYPENFGIFLISIGKVKPGFLLYSICIFSEPNGTKSWSHSFHLQNSVFCRPEWAKGGSPWKWILTTFKWKNEFPNQLGLEKQMKKMGWVIFLVFMSTSWVMVLKLSKIVCFFHFFAGISNKSKYVIAVYVYAFDSSWFALLENGIVLTYSLEGISFWRWWISLNFCWFSTFFVLFLNISWTGSDPYKTYYFWKSMMRSFRWI